MIVAVSSNVGELDVQHIGEEGGVLAIVLTSTFLKRGMTAGDLRLG
jgi:hypothetical protein